MNCIVVGGAGFIGSHLCEYLLGKGNDVFCVDNLVTGDVCNIEDAYNYRNFHFIRQDATHFNVAKTLAEQVNLKAINEIYYLASIASPDKYLKMPLETIEANLIGLRNFLEIAVSNKIKFLYTSTSEVYGDPLEHPQRESYTGNVDTCCDRAVYDESKRMGETLVATYHRHYGLNTRIVRIFNTYGPRMGVSDGRVIPNFISQAIKNKDITVYGNGSQTRSFCYVSDLIRAICLIMNCTYYLPINIGNPYCYFSIVELAGIIKELTMSESQIISVPFKSQNDPKVRRPDITLVRNKTSWSPSVDLRVGLKHTIDYFKNK